MALGAWLLLFQNNLRPGGPGGPGGAEALTTFAPNKVRLTSFHDSHLHEIAKENTQALYLGATGSSLYEDETITSGHTHCEGPESALLWRQVANFKLTNLSAGTIGASPDEAFDAALVESAIETDLAQGELWLTELQAASLIPRIQVSTDASLTDTARLCLRYYQTDGTLIATQSPAISVSTSHLLVREWAEGTAIDLRDAEVDDDFPTRRALLVKLSTFLDGGLEPIAVHELSFGVYL